MTAAGTTDAVVICTRNRPAELEGCLRSLVAQTRPAGEVLVVDSSTGPAAEEVVRRLAAEHPAMRLRHQPSQPGLTHQRNVGVDATTAGILHFLDDDVVLDPGYLAAVMAHFAGHPEVGGVGGRVVNVTPPRASAVHEWLGLDSRQPGRVLPSGVNVPVRELPDDGPVPVEWLSGCAMSYRREAMAGLRFDERLTGYGLGEDLDFSYRVGRRATLMLAPDARLVHLESPRNRLAERAMHRLTVVRRYRFVRSGQPALRRGAFWRAVVGQVVLLGALGIVRRDGRLLRRAGWTAAGALDALRAAE